MKAENDAVKGIARAANEVAFVVRITAEKTLDVDCRSNHTAEGGRAKRPAEGPQQPRSTVRESDRLFWRFTKWTCRR